MKEFRCVLNFHATIIAQPLVGTPEQNSQLQFSEGSAHSDAILVCGGLLLETSQKLVRQ